MRSAREVVGAGELSAEVVVIGSGAGGAVVAAKLAEAGVATLLLEEGEHHPAATMTQNEHEMIPRLFQESGQRSTRDQSILIMQGRALGGSSTHNTGLCVPVRESLWSEWQEQHAVPCGWQDFAPYLDRVMATLGARVADEDEINRNNQLLREGARAAGLSFFVAHHNRLQCSGCGYCTLGCAYNRKLSVVHAFLPAGIAAGLDIVTGCRALRVAPAGGGGWRIEARASEGGAPISIRAGRIVLSAGAIATPLLLARSRLASPAVVGRSLRLHPFAPVGAVFEEEILAWRGVPQSVIVDSELDPGGGGGYLLMVAASQPAATAALVPALGSEHRRMMKGYRHLAAAGVLLHDRTAGRVRERGDGKPLIEYWPNRADCDDLRRGIRQLAELYFARGARAVVLPFLDRPILETRAELDALDALPMRPHSLILASAHPQGTCPMGRDARASVTDGSGQVHGQPGLYVADTSLFPTSIGVPPQVTTMALGWRLADHLAGLG